MKKIVIVISLTFLTISLYAKPSFDERIVDDYHKVGGILMYGTYPDIEDHPDAEKYLLKAMRLMEEYKLDMNSFRAADIYNSLGHLYKGERFTESGDCHISDSGCKPYDKQFIQSEIEKKKKSIMYLEKSYTIKKKLGKGYEDSAADTRGMIIKVKEEQEIGEKKLLAF